ncbi:hypothetical protein PIB30_088982 [Stylosanthes scabra]|uniref:DUF4283 domain-containing protein n=1 Tax=Stylosanthes scabra TaxID=79078 RepID=A0ABU6VV11_9FABA|nr:hypothetical protein [Stylosanthes scabra]
MDAEVSDRPPDRSNDLDGEDEVVLLEEEDISKSFRVCAKSLIGRVFADRIFSVGTMESALGAIWARPAGFRVTDLGKNLFQFFFDCENDAVQIVKGIWGLPEQFKTLEVGCKLARRIGKVREVDLFEVKEDSQKNRVRQEALGEWIKADQVGRRIYSPDFRKSDESDNGKKSSPHPEKKPLPNWLAKSFSKLNLKENLSGDSEMKKNQAARNEEDESLNSEGGREILSELAVPMNMEENVIVGNSYTPIRRNIQRIKQAARQKGGDGGIGKGGKRPSSAKENVGSGKRICLESRDLKQAEVEGANRQLAPKEL